jgi:hypothetical protein
MLRLGIVGRSGPSLALPFPFTLALAPRLGRGGRRIVIGDSGALKETPSGPRHATALVRIGDPPLSHLHLRKESAVEDVGQSILAPRIPEFAVPAQKVGKRRKSGPVGWNTRKVVRKRAFRRKRRDLDPSPGRLTEDRGYTGPRTRNIGFDGLSGLDRLGRDASTY